MIGGNRRPPLFGTEANILVSSLVEEARLGGELVQTRARSGIVSTNYNTY